jgi:Tfp pilus assembly protein PilX
MKKLIQGMSQKRRLRGDQGFILISTFLFMLTLIVIIATYAAFVSSDARNSSSQVDNAKALYLSESGINKAVWYLENTAPDDSTDGSWRTSGYPVPAGPDPTDPQQEPFAEGTYTMWVEDLGVGILITSRGEVNHARRVVQQRFSLSEGEVSSLEDSWKEI